MVTDLPAAVISRINQFLDPSDALSLAHTSSYLYSVVTQDGVLWKRHCGRVWRYIHVCIYNTSLSLSVSLFLSFLSLPVLPASLSLSLSRGGVSNSLTVTARGAGMIAGSTSARSLVGTGHAMLRSSQRGIRSSSSSRRSVNNHLVS